MEFYIAIEAIIIAIGLWNLIIAILGCFPRCRATAVGTLQDARTRRNIKGRHGSVIPIQTTYMYIYTVKGKTYQYRSSQNRAKKNLFRKVTMVYVRWFPRHAYPNKFSGINEWLMAIFCILMGALYGYAMLQT